ncbi:hypothetical protein MHH60_28395 [Paenibacillus sp. FSL H7-0716]|uniref:Uncharacterized protein n=1 Tax=Paenibacillus odorifer TaxID=189426 RepID=A0A1R0XY99_9BACL|nr:hypothetical protein [Paenibacillus odorifer]OMD40066.1 hypothetical protein BSK52_14320 [Paenibacillus odorifer]OME19818.1 hypothetical protein BSK47_14700 [Paenibacillus odorifer]
MLHVQEADPLLGLQSSGFRYEERIRSIEVFRFDQELTQRLLSNNEKDSICGYLKLSGNGFRGWGEYRLPCSSRTFDLVGWASVFMNLKGLDVAQAFQLVQEKEEKWGRFRKELAESTLLNCVPTLRSPVHLPFPKEHIYFMEHTDSYVSF